MTAYFFQKKKTLQKLRASANEKSENEYSTGEEAVMQTDKLS